MSLYERGPLLLAESRVLRIGLIPVLLFLSDGASAQISTPPRVAADYVNAVAFGLSYGEKTDRDAAFWGWSADYSRRLSERWTAGLSLTWDEETEQIGNQSDNVVQSYNLIGTISYSLTPSLSLATGLGKEFANDANANQSMKFKNGDVSTGLSLGYAWALTPRHSLGASVAYEYNISAKETSFSVDLTIGFSF